MPYHVSVTRSVVGALLLGLVMLAYAEALQRLRTAETGKPPIWGGYARDAINMSATLSLWAVHLIFGFGGATALLAGLLTTLAVYVLDWTISVGLRLRPSRLLMPLLLGWAVLVGMAPGRVMGAFSHLIARALP